MTVAELRLALQALEASGLGALDVCFNDSDYGWEPVHRCSVVSGWKNRITARDYADFVGIDCSAGYELERSQA